MAAFLDRLALRVVQLASIAALFGLCIFVIQWQGNKPHAIWDADARFSYADHVSLKERFPDGRFVDAGLFIYCYDGKFQLWFADGSAFSLDRACWR